MQPLKSYLLNLTSTRAANLFLLMLILGSASIWSGFFVPWLPALIVLLYGSLLLYAATSLLVTHSEMTNNSPYFLGFLLFLVSLFTTFMKFGLRPDSNQTHFLIGQIGSALLTTIIGLPFRQLLFAYSPGQKEQDTFFRTLEEELRRSAVQFKKSQSELVQLLQEFIASREILFTEEEKASKRYVENLSKAAGLFNEAMGAYPAQIAAALSQTSKSVTKIKTKLEQLATSADGFNSAIFQDVLKQFESLGQSTAAATAQTDALKEGFRTVSQTADKVPALVEKAFADLTTKSDDVGAQLKKRLEIVLEDLRAIDTVIDDFVEVMRGKVTALSSDVPN